MKFKKFNFFNAKWFLILGLFLSSLSVLRINAQSSQDIMLYSTDFTGWTAVSGIGSNGTYPQSTGDGAGFILDKKPEIAPSGTINGYTGYYTNASSSHTITFPALNFVSGGVVEVVYCVDQGSGVTITMSGADYVKFEEINDPSNAIGTNYKNIKAGDEALGDKNGWFANYKDWHLGNNVTARYEGTYYKILFSFPSSFKGEKVLTLASSKQYDKIVSMKVWTSVGTTPYVAATDYPNAGADGSKASSGVVLQALPGGNVIEANVDVKAYNITSPVSLSIIGDGAAQFSLTQTTIDASAALAGTSIPVKFTSSPTSGISKALLVLSSPGAEDYYVNLLGQSGTGNPEIIADNSLMRFHTYQTGRITQELNVSGLSLTGPITATLSDGNFSLPSSEISLYNALNGTKLKITFTGDIVEGTKDATLTLSSPGAENVVIPLQGVTTLTKPHLYKITFEAVPAGSAAIKHTPGGNLFLEGEKITVTVTPNVGYNIVSWSDNAGSTKSTRVITATMPTHIKINLSNSGTQGPSGGGSVGSSFVAKVATNVTANSLSANWSAATNSNQGATTTYTVTLYDAAGNQVDQKNVGTELTAEFTGLSPYTPYYYQVHSTSTDPGQTETKKAGPFYTIDDAVYVCGKGPGE